MKLTTWQLLILLAAIGVMAVIMLAAPPSTCSCRGAEVDVRVRIALALAAGQEAEKPKVIVQAPVRPMQFVPMMSPMVCIGGS